MAVRSSSPLEQQACWHSARDTLSPRMPRRLERCVVMISSKYLLVVKKVTVAVIVLLLSSFWHYVKSFINIHILIHQGQIPRSTSQVFRSHSRYFSCLRCGLRDLTGRQLYSFLDGAFDRGSGKSHADVGQNESQH